jgi:hypothetical protein
MATVTDTVTTANMAQYLKDKVSSVKATPIDDIPKVIAHTTVLTKNVVDCRETKRVFRDRRNTSALLSQGTNSKTVLPCTRSYGRIHRIIEIGCR